MDRGRRLKIRGETWRLVIGRPPANECDALCHYERKTIYIRKSAERIPAIVHEVLHASLPDMCEETVEEIEAAIVKALELAA